MTNLLQFAARDIGRVTYLRRLAVTRATNGDRRGPCGRCPDAASIPPRCAGASGAVRPWSPWRPAGGPAGAPMSSERPSAIVTGAMVTGAMVTGAMVTGAMVTGAMVTSAMVTSAMVTSATVMGMASPSERDGLFDPSRLASRGGLARRGVSAGGPGATLCPVARAGSRGACPRAARRRGLRGEPPAPGGRGGLGRHGPAEPACSSRTAGREERQDRARPADWTRGVPPAASSATPAFRRAGHGEGQAPGMRRHPAPARATSAGPTRLTMDRSAGNGGAAGPAARRARSSVADAPPVGARPVSELPGLGLGELLSLR
jgi:hypothetical protein